MIDDTDIQILKKLKEDGRMPLTEIAESLNLANSTVSARFEKLKEKGIITSFRTAIDYEKLGLQLTSMISIKGNSEKIPEVARKLKQDERVICFFQVTGDTDMVIITRFIDREDMNRYIKSLQQKEGIESTETNVILTKPKIEDDMDIQKIINQKELSR